MRNPPIGLAGPISAPAVNYAHPLNRGRAFWWLVLPGQMGGSRWSDLFGGYPATVTNLGAGNGWKGTNQPGGHGTITLDGVSGYLTSPSPPSLDVGTGDVTVAAWASIPSSASAGFLLANTSGSGVTGFDLIYGAGGLAGHIDFRIQGATGGSYAGSVNDGIWRRYVGVRRNGNMYLYANGVQVTTGAVGNSVTSTGPLQCGARNGVVNTGFAASVNDLTAWARALSENEIKSDYDLSRRFYPDVLNRWRPAVSPTSAQVRRRLLLLGVGA